MTAKQLINGIVEDSPVKLIISKEQKNDAQTALVKASVQAGFMTAGFGEVNLLVDKSELPAAEKVLKAAGIEYYRF